MEERLCISLEEASKISMIGINRLRDIMKNTDCPFSLTIGNKKKVVKIKEFKEWISKQENI